MTKKVYLAGPITGTSWAESETWRDDIKQLALLDPRYSDIEFFSPLRGKEYIKDNPEIKDSYPEYQFSTSKCIMLRDFHDVQTADAVVVYLKGARKVSIGTVMEIAWAYQRRIPVIAIIEPFTEHKTGFQESVGPNIHEHAMLNEAFWYRFETIQEALYALGLLFKP